MTEPPDHGLTNRRPWWSRLRFSVRICMLAVAVVAVIFATQYRRTAITPQNIERLAKVATLDKNDIYQIAWSRERDRMAVVGWEKPVEIRDAVSLDLLETIGEGQKIIHFAFSPKGGVVAYCENGTTACILDRRTGKTIALNAMDAQPALVFNPDGTLLATGGYGTSVRLWRVDDGQHVKTIDAGDVKGGLTPEFSPDGRLLAIGNRNFTTGIFDVATGKQLFRLPKRMSQEIQFSPDGKKLAVVYVDASIALWNVADGSLIVERKTPAEELYTVDWSPDGSLLATAGLKGKITIWSAGDLSVVRELPAPEWVVRVRFTPDGLNLHYAGGAASVGGKRRLEVLGIEGSLYSLLNRPRQSVSSSAKQTRAKRGMPIRSPGG
jgi:dipeptidyl aminopeptidase/acylaminoacyl peptidase